MERSGRVAADSHVRGLQVMTVCVPAAVEEEGGGGRDAVSKATKVNCNGSFSHDEDAPEAASNQLFGDGKDGKDVMQHWKCV